MGNFDSHRFCTVEYFIVQYLIKQAILQCANTLVHRAKEKKLKIQLKNIMLLYAQLTKRDILTEMHD